MNSNYEVGWLEEEEEESAEEIHSTKTERDRGYN